MDFLDPAKRRQHKTRLIIGYCLVSVAIFLTATILVYWASGYGFNTKTGRVVENGLLFVDSKPGGASIYLNGQPQGTTSARLNLNAGTYTLALKRSGYYDWQNKLTIAGQSVIRIVYPFLFPKQINPQELKTYPSLPAVSTESQNHHWLLVEQSSGNGSFSFDEYDTTKTTAAPVVLNLPTGLLTSTDRPDQVLTVVGWASDNDHLLLQHSFAGGTELVVFNRVDPSSSLNLSRDFGFSPSGAAFNNGRFDQIFLYNQANNSVGLANISKKDFAPAIDHVLDWRSVGDKLLFYVTDQGAPAGQVSFRIWDAGKSYTLYSLPSTKRYLFEATEYQSHWYYALGSDASGRVILYRDPLDGLKDASVGKATPLVSLATHDSPVLSFSVNGRFVAVQSGQYFNVYDTETDTRYQYSMNKVASQLLNWMDGNRLMGKVDGNVFVMDFDSENQHQLLPTAGGPVFFDGSFNHLYNFVPAADNGGVSLQASDLRAGTDRPKQ